MLTGSIQTNLHHAASPKLELTTNHNTSPSLPLHTTVHRSAPHSTIEHSQIQFRMTANNAITASTAQHRLVLPHTSMYYQILPRTTPYQPAPPSTAQYCHTLSCTMHYTVAPRVLAPPAHMYPTSRCINSHYYQQFHTILHQQLIVHRTVPIRTTSLPRIYATFPQNSAKGYH